MDPLESDWLDAAERDAAMPKEPAGLALSEAALVQAARADSAASMRPTWLAICADWRKAYRYA